MIFQEKHNSMSSFPNISLKPNILDQNDKTAPEASAD